MSKIIIEVEGNRARIENRRSRFEEYNTQEIILDELIRNKVYRSGVRISKEEDKNKVFYFEKCEQMLEEAEENGEAEEAEENGISEEAEEAEETEESEGTGEAKERADTYFLVYADGQVLKYTMGSPEVLLKKLIPFKNKIWKLHLGKNQLVLWIAGYIINKYKNIEMGSQRITVGEKIGKAADFKVTTGVLGKIKRMLPCYMQRISLPLDSLLENVEAINNAVWFELNMLGIDVRYGLSKRKRRVLSSKKYFAPVARKIVDGFMMFVRRNKKGNIVLVTRPVDPYEKTLRYRFWESSPVSWLLYQSGRVFRKISKKPVNIYFEKESMKAEEGAFEVFDLACRERSSENYFIIGENTSDYERLKGHKNIVKKYSPKYYWILYRANSAITTEAPAHMNILRSGNKYIRLRNVLIQFVFLQHGVTYMKRHGRASAFVRGREAEPKYIFVGSEKERDIVCDMLRLPEERIFVTGLPIFSTVKYCHITQESEDYVAIMLTFKPYEERLDDFENSGYYHSILNLYGIVKKYISEDKILLAAHPRIHYLLETTSLKERIWTEPISAMLEKAKLLITDYSSVAYNSFYQGAGVLFYQEDLEEYEAICGKLIPNEDEYIGMRAFNLEMFEEEIKHIIREGKIQLSAARTEEQEKVYDSINSFCDGKNAERIYQTLKEQNLI